MNRKKSREIAMKALYQMDINKSSCEQALANIKEIIENEELNSIDFEYIQNIINGVTETKSELDCKIEENLKSWKLNRISKVNLCILRLSIYEIIYINDIPNKVSINEAVELSKTYAEEKSHKFINGILANFL